MYSPGQKFPVTQFFQFSCVHICVNQMLNTRNNTYYVYFEIFNQIYAQDGHVSLWVKFHSTRWPKTFVYKNTKKFRIDLSQDTVAWLNAKVACTYRSLAFNFDKTSSWEIKTNVSMIISFYGRKFSDKYIESKLKTRLW